jgi:hypothetical protein
MPCASDEADFPYAVFAYVLLVQLDEVVGSSADRALGLDLQQHEMTVLDPNVEQVALTDTEHPPQLRRYDHPTQLVDAASGANRSH